MKYRKLKSRVRERMEKTGESYQAALRKIREKEREEKESLAAADASTAREGAKPESKSSPRRRVVERDFAEAMKPKSKEEAMKDTRKWLRDMERRRELIRISTLSGNVHDPMSRHREMMRTASLSAKDLSPFREIERQTLVARDLNPLKQLSRDSNPVAKLSQQIDDLMAPHRKLSELTDPFRELKSLAVAAKPLIDTKIPRY